MEKQDIGKNVRAALAHSPFRENIRRVSLFGSHLHGTAHRESDIDLLIEFHKPTSIFKLVHLEQDLTDALGAKVDLSTPMSLSRYFRSDVLQEAEPLFEAVP